MQVSAWRLARWGHAQPGTPPPAALLSLTQWRAVLASAAQ